MSASKTLLQMTEDILSDINGDEINNINDTEESMQVAKIIVQTYYDLHSKRNWPMDKGLLNLTALGDIDLPNYLKVDDDFTEIIDVNYDKARLKDAPRVMFEDVKWREPDDFLRYTNKRVSTNDNIQTVTDPTGVRLLIQNNYPPEYYTSFDDEHIVFDRYDAEVDTTVQATKTQAMAYKMPVFELDGDAVPKMPIDAFSELINTARAKANYWLRDFADQESKGEAMSQSRWMARKNWRVQGGIRFPNYGRQRRGYKYSHKDPTFRRDNQ